MGCSPSGGRVLPDLGATRCREAATITSIADVHWPSETCVTAWVVAAIGQLGYASPEPRDFARRLGTRVGPGAANPWDLEVTTDRAQVGVSAVAAEQRLPSILREIDATLSFRYAPSTT